MKTETKLVTVEPVGQITKKNTVHHQSTQTHLFNNNRSCSAWLVWDCMILSRVSFASAPSWRPPWSLPLKSSGFHFTSLYRAPTMRQTWPPSLRKSLSSRWCGHSRGSAHQERGRGMDGEADDAQEAKVLLRDPEHGVDQLSVLSCSLPSPSPAQTPQGHKLPRGCDWFWNPNSPAGSEMGLPTAVSRGCKEITGTWMQSRSSRTNFLQCKSPELSLKAFPLTQARTTPQWLPICTDERLAGKIHLSLSASALGSALFCPWLNSHPNFKRGIFFFLIPQVRQRNCQEER